MIITALHIIISIGENGILRGATRHVYLKWTVVETAIPAVTFGHQ